MAKEGRGGSRRVGSREAKNAKRQKEKKKKKKKKEPKTGNETAFL
jgi:hypothetical protein